jgi:hypothetical protein
MGVGSQHHDRGRDQVPLAEKAGWGLGLVKYTDIFTSTSGHIHNFIYLFRFEVNVSIMVAASSA